jgi:dipeptidase E
MPEQDDAAVIEQASLGGGPAGKVFAKLLLTSSGISNPSISDALAGLLGKPVAESSALFVPTAIYPFPDGPARAFQAISGNARSPLCDLG